MKLSKDAIDWLTKVQRSTKVSVLGVSAERRKTATRDLEEKAAHGPFRANSLLKTFTGKMKEGSSQGPVLPH
jgi:hypothetical protein